jgi:membrane associated rhomboid family serine protease
MRATWRRNDYEVGWGRQIMPCVKWLIIINVVVFIVQALFHYSQETGFKYFFVFDALFSLSPKGISEGFVWQFLTYMFLHVDPWHLIFNMLGLFFLGNEVEATLGPKRFLQIYLLSGLVGGVAWYLSVLGQTGAALQGASGCVFGVVAAFATLYPNRPITMLLFFVLPLTILAKYLAIFYVLSSVLYLVTSTREIAHLAHLGGLAVGFFYIKAMASPGWQPRIKWLSKARPTVISKKVEPFRSPLRKDEFMKKQIDPILDKIAESGIHSLTKEERKLLDEAKDRLN